MTDKPIPPYSPAPLPKIEGGVEKYTESELRKIALFSRQVVEENTALKAEIAAIKAHLGL